MTRNDQGAKRQKAGAVRVLGRRAILATIAIVTIALISGCSDSRSSFLHPYGPVAAAQRSLFFDVIGWMTIVVVPVFVMLPLFAWRYRRRNAASTYRPKWEFSWGLEILVWGVPVIIVAVLAYGIWTKQTALDPYRPLASSKPPLEVQVVGLDWKWLFIYPEQGIATVGVVAMPVDRPVHFTLTSDTVMQSFFIPSLGSQIYAMAGMETQLNLLADRPGTVEGMNTQFNGMGFQNQKFTVRAMPESDFDTWVATVKATGKPLLDAAAFRALSENSAPKSATAEPGVATSPAQEMYFSAAAPGLFASIVGRHDAAGGGQDMDSSMTMKPVSSSSAGQATQTKNDQEGQ